MQDEKRNKRYVGGDETPIEDANLYVPRGMLDTYKSTSPWSGFGTILPLTEEIEVSVDETRVDFSYPELT